MLLRMQKALRSKSAAQKRQVWEEQLEEKRQKLQQRDRDTQSGMYSGELTFFSSTSMLRYQFANKSKFSDVLRQSGIISE